jgi:cytochrome c553
VVLRYLGALLGLMTVTVFMLTVLGWVSIETPRRRPVRDFVTAADSLDRDRGRRLTLAACSCHGNADGALAGGARSQLQGAGFGTLWAPNLTPGGPVARYSDSELARAIREGLDPKGRPLALMPTHLFRDLSDRDLAATMEFLRRQSASPNEVPSRRLGPLLYLLVSTRVMDSPVLPELRGPVSGPLPNPEPGYGRYLTRILRCVECHGDEMEGGHEGRLRGPRGPNLLVPDHDGSYDAFVRAVREGTNHGDRPIEAHRPPWNFYSPLGEPELRAIYEYLRAS